MKQVISTFAIAALTSSVVMAGAMKNQAVESFDVLDLDQDGTVTATEAASHPKLAEVFATIDRNKDSQISKEEYSAYLAEIEKKS
ncbi:hypothetical protein [Motiliproteus sp. MSK22-1]|uniref:hypothetical protein n=1 Tax=Motiliproteus sp. MSK22-1 TaxID=1897630 RepID=UPI0009FB5C97|nr:hypothetical protein [Motiliproteus sp. MSK22-1]